MENDSSEKNEIPAEISTHLRFNPVFGDLVAGKSLQETLRRAFLLYSDFPWLGTKIGDNNYSWKTFGSVESDSKHVGSGLLQILENTRSFVGIYLDNSIEWVVMDIACVMYDFVSVPLATTLDESQLVYIINHSEISLLITTEDKLNIILSASKQCPTLKTIVIVQSSNQTWTTTSNISKIITYETLMDLGKSKLVEPPSSINETNLMTILYTSGSTGKPKGAMNSFGRWNAFVTPAYLMPKKLVRLAFTPLAHATERQLTWLTLCFGGQQVFFSGDMDKLFDEFKSVRPTQISCPPRVYSLIYNRYSVKFDEVLRSLPQPIDCQTYKKTQEEVMSLFSGVFGDRLEWMVIGGASSSSHLREFLQAAFKIPVYDGYGTTEAGSIASNNMLFPNVEARLVSVPDMGYTTEDIPFPRGEILVKTPQMISGYYKDNTSTDENFVDGWFRTGDIGERLANGMVRIIDRCKNILKLEQGVFVEPSKIEDTLLQCSWVEQIFVHGDINQSFLVAAVVPNEKLIKTWIENNNKKIDDIYNDEEVLKKVHHEILSFSKTKGLHSYEVPASIYLEKNKFTPENQLLTPSFKPARTVLRNHYKEIFAKLFEESKNKKANVSNKIRDAVRQAFNSEEISDNDDLFGQLGADSLSTVRLAGILNDRLSTKINVASLYNLSTLSISDIAQMVLNSEGPEQRSDASSLPDLNNLTLQVQYHREAEDDLRAARTPMFTQTNPITQYDLVIEMIKAPKNILLTGATGFLGSFLLVELLKLTQSDVYCLVRCTEANDGKVRILNILERYNVNVEESWKERIFVIPSDISKPQLGINNADYYEYAKKIDVIYHSAAIVNWMMRYSEMRKTNVHGTCSLIHFASFQKTKPFFYVSTLSTGTSVEGVLVPEDYAMSTYFGHYALSKWVAEQYVLNAASCGIPCIIFKPGNITGSSKTGACHKTDYIPRLINSLVSMKSYFQSDNKMEFMPVDFVANSIVSISLDPTMCSRCYHITNHSGLTYSKLGEIISALGLNLERLDYEAWRKRFLEIIEKNTNFPLSPLSSFFGVPFTMNHNFCEKTNFLNALQKLGKPDCDPPSEEYVQNIVNYLLKSNV
eukprot:TRINITY_DN4197_c0_g3_i2.p1 TRINITY_DN4197_c0_g3~~TRINITY_DN4197_c0_g3_i2.p1  ORF type:complete len:1095 (+),score=120.04 TRINITY_DN4197_c0_g3_i2:560-3844(+)